ncbi:MAG: prepilin-type N-terminal cleavage/methylation domain-containing protein [Planctomycetota bacterium]|nr:prepilin-type N-terminal cleavage/methylation domain-containing protein [Planctomycetota bacterium]
MPRATVGFTLVEILIVVTILGILAMMVVPKYGDAATEAREAAITADLQSIQRQIDRYKVDHKGRGPHLGPTGIQEPANFVARLTGRTDTSGALVSTGTHGPYLPEMPDNPFIANSKLAGLVKVGKGARSPRDGTTGWFFEGITQKIMPNSKTGAAADFPLAGAH